MSPIAFAFAALVAMFRRALCGLVDGHLDRLHVDRDTERLFLVCDVCARRSAGWDVQPTPPARWLPGDPRRFQSYARRLPA